MAGNNFQVVVKVIETSLGRTISADEQFFPIDKNIAAILGIEFNESTNPNISNRGFNQPLNSNEQYNNAATVNKDCEKNNTGDYCFFNNTKVEIYVYDRSWNVPSSNFNFVSNFMLKPRQSKCVYNLDIKIIYKFAAFLEEPESILRANTFDQGDFQIEKCKSKTYNIK